MTLPHAANAIVPQDKITQYLLNLNHSDGGSKAKFFLRHGYTLADWSLLANDLRIHGQTYMVSGQRPAVNGINYSVVGPLAMPDGVTGNVKTVWYIETNDTQPSLATAYPTR